KPSRDRLTIRQFPYLYRNSTTTIPLVAPYLLDLPKLQHPFGNYAIIEHDAVPFEVKRAHYLYDVPSGAERGGHRHIHQSAVLIAVSGSFDVVLKDGKTTQTFSLNKPDKGLFVGTGIWRELNNFSSGAICLVLSSGEFDEADYIRDYDDFLQSLS